LKDERGKDWLSRRRGLLSCGAGGSVFSAHKGANVVTRSEAYEAERLRMVAEQLAARGIRDTAVLAALQAVPRHLFVAAEFRHRAYDDQPLPIGHRQTISQPYMVALMTEVLSPRRADRVLEVGCGSGYQAAVLAELGAQVYSIERVPDLARVAVRRLDQLGYSERVSVRVGDGAEGWSEAGPFDGIIITAAARRIPRRLLGQLAPGGRLVVPLGEDDLQGLVRIRRGDAGWVEDYFGECRFVKLIGEDGWTEA
jgi:protein-L-isoaspartate(D-aspartate) O-methyltransferase